MLIINPEWFNIHMNLKEYCSNLKKEKNLWFSVTLINHTGYHQCWTQKISSFIITIISSSIFTNIIIIIINIFNVTFK